MAVLDFGRFQISNSSSERIETISAPEDITNKTVDDDGKLKCSNVYHIP